MHPKDIISSLDKMRKQLKKVVFKTTNRREKVFAFIDAQNIAKGIENSGWKINWGTFRQWLAQNYNVSQAYMYIGYMEKNRDLYLQLNNNGFNIDLKQTIKAGNRDYNFGESDVKGNVDVDLTIGVWREYANYNKAIIISGDGDFTSLIQYLLDKKKLKNIIVPQFYSSLFKQFEEYIVELNQYREELIYIKSSKRPIDPKPAVVKPLRKTTVAKALSKRRPVTAKIKTGVSSSSTTSNRHKIKQTLKRKIHLLNKR